MTSGIRAVVWDLGGVILRTFDRSGRERWERQLGLEPCDLSRLVFNSEVSRRASAGQATIDEVWSWVQSHLSLSNEDLAALRQEFFAGDRLDEELLAYIRRLRPRCKTGMITNAFPDLRRWLQDVWRIAVDFDQIVISAEEGLLKPDPRIYHLALDRLDVAPQQAVFVDDFAENVAGAQEAGMRAIQFRDTQQTIAELDALLINGG